MTSGQHRQNGQSTRRPRRTSAVRRRHARRGPLVAGTAAVLIIGIAAYAAFGPGLPFESQYELRAVFATSNELGPGSDVRIGGISIGSVERVGSGPGHTALVTIRIADRSVPIHADARLTIDPRLALEGNYYINVSPGTPLAPVLRAGATIPLAQTSGLVQIDQLVDTFTLPTRHALKSSIAQLAGGLGSAGSTTRSPGTGSDGLRRATRELDGALGSIAQVSEAAQGTQPGDLSRALGSTGAFTAQLSESPAALAGLVTSFDHTFAALAANTPALSASIAQLDDVLKVAPERLTSIDAALPGLTSFALALRPALRQAPMTLGDTNRMLSQIGQLVEHPELPSLLDALEPVTASLPTLEVRLDALFPYVTLAMNCVSQKVVPGLDMVAPDGPNTTGAPAWLDFLHLAAGLASSSANSDANGTALRLGITESDVDLQATIPGLGAVFVPGKVDGLDPTWLGLGVYPPDRPDQRCVDQPLPNLGARDGAPPAEFRPSSISPQQREENSALAALRAAILTGSRSKVIAALAPVLELEGIARNVVERLTSGTANLSKTLRAPKAEQKPGPSTTPPRRASAPMSTGSAPDRSGQGSSTPAPSATGLLDKLLPGLSRLLAGGG